jgi:hypothetical protein
VQQCVETTVYFPRHRQDQALINDKLSESVPRGERAARAAPRSVVGRCHVPYLHRMARTRSPPMMRTHREIEGGVAMLMTWVLGCGMHGQGGHAGHAGHADQTDQNRPAELADTDHAHHTGGGRSTS